MTIFAVIPQPNPRTAQLGAAVESNFSDENYKLEDGGGWLIASKRPTQEISNLLGVTDGTNGAALVFEIASYFGRANPNIWTWIKTKWESSASG